MISQNTVTFRLAKRTALATFIAAILLVAGGTATAAVIMACAEELAASDEMSRVERASRLDPGNDSIQNRLGRMELWSGGDLEQAMQRYRRAVTLNPNNAEYWADLAQACQLTGQTSCTETSLQRAVRLAPTRPRFRWELANYYVLTGAREKALSAFAQLLSIAPERAESGLNICLRAYGDPDPIWHAVVLPSGSASVELTMLSMMAHRKIRDTGEYWAEARDKKFDFAAVAPYLDTLIDNGTYDLALRVWDDLQQRGVIRPSSGNPVYNGYFKDEPLNAGFDWHLVPQLFVQTSIEDGPRGMNGRSLRVEFTVPSNVDLEPAYQVLPIVSGATHILRAWVKSEGIASDSGPKLRLVDAGCSACLDVSSTATTGTTDWHQIQLSFATTETRTVRLSLYRPRSRTFPTDITGSFWVTAVTLDSNQ